MDWTSLVRLPQSYLLRQFYRTQLTRLTEAHKRGRAVDLGQAVNEPETLVKRSRFAAVFREKTLFSSTLDAGNLDCKLRDVPRDEKPII